MRRLPLILPLAAVLLAFGCGDDDAEEADGGPAPMDSSVPSDGGSIAEDGATEDGGAETDAAAADAFAGDAGDPLMGCDPAASPFGAGAGTEADPYLLCATDHWLALGPDPDVYHHLVSDLDFTGVSYTPIADFQGILEGGDHALQNVTIEGIAQGALFAEVFGATIRDLRVENLAIAVADQAAGLVVFVVGTRPSGSFSVGAASTFEHIQIEGTIETTAESGSANGLFGTFARGTATDLSFAGSVEGDFAAGAIGNTGRETTTRRLRVDADVVGDEEASGAIRLALGTIEEVAVHGSATAGGRVSGLFGDLTWSGAPAVADVYSDMDLTLTHAAALASGSTGSEVYRVAGLVATPRFGRDRAGSMADFYFGGTITTVDEPPTGFASVAGGLFACWGGYTGCNGEWLQGGCYWDTESSGRTNQGGGPDVCTGLTTAELRTPSETPELETPPWEKSSGAAPTLTFETP